MLGPRLRFWFTGDSGYCSVFPEIGERLGPFDLSLIPTGAYAPRWFMKPQHTDPGEAVAIHQEVRSMRSVACHLATFALTDEPMDEPVRRLPEVRGTVPAAALRRLLPVRERGARVVVASVAAAAAGSPATN